MFLKPGDHVDRYVVEDLVGEGGTSAIYRVRHAQLGSLHALKVLRVVLESLRARTVIEGRIQARVRHPNLVPVTDIVMVQEVPALVMDFIDGPTLEDWLLGGRRQLTQLDAIARGILEGVAFAHEHDLVHRDLKPSNVLLQRDGVRLVPRIADFGLAKALDAELQGSTRSGAMMGTLDYMSPEQIIDSKNVDRRADLYSVSCILYQALTGATPFHGANLVERHQRALAEDYTRLAHHRADLEPRMVNAIEAGLRGKIEDRVDSARALLALWVGMPPVPLPDDDSLWGASMPPGTAAHVADPTLVPGGTLIEGGAAPGERAIPEAPARRREPTVAFPPEELDPPRAKRAPWAIGVVLALIALAGVRLFPDAPPPASAVIEPVPPAPEAVLAPEEPTSEPGVAVPAEAAPASEAVAVVAAAPPVAKPEPRVAEPLQASSKPEVAAPTGGVVTVEGVGNAYLLDASGARFRPGAVPPGDYRLYVFFDPAEPTKVMDLSVGSSGTRAVHCSPVARACR